MSRTLVRRPASGPTPLEALRAIPEEEVWLQSRQSARTREAYRNDVAGFLTFLGIRSTEELRAVDHRAVYAFKRQLEDLGSAPATIRRKLAALSSLFNHLVHHQVLKNNPAREVTRPRVNRREGTTPAFSVEQVRALLEAPDPNTLQGVRDRAILSVGFQVGPRRAEIAGLKVSGFQPTRGLDALQFRRKGGETHTVAIHPQAAQRIRLYLEVGEHGEDLEGPLFRPVRGNQHAASTRRHLEPKSIDGVLKRYVKELGIEGRYSAHSMRATFITTALDNGASLEEVQRAAGHANADTTKLYDRRGHQPEKSASFFASY